MLKMHLAAGLAAAALMTSPVLAQGSNPASGGAAPAGQNAAASGQLMAQMPQGMMRASDLKGVDVYGSDNQKIGDVDEMVVDKQGKIHAIVVGVGGFLGIGQKDVAIPFDQVQWVSNQEVQAQNNQNQNQNRTPATTGSTGAAGAAGSGNMAAPTGGGASGTNTAGTTTAGNNAGTAGGADSNAPARAMVKMTKADLQNAPEFRYSANEGNRGAATGAGGGAGAGGAAGSNAPRQ